MGGDSVLSCHTQTNGYALTNLTWMMEDTELAMENEVEEVEGVIRSELRLSDYLTERGEVEVWCLASLAVPDFSLSSDSLTVTLVGQILHFKPTRRGEEDICAVTFYIS